VGNETTARFTPAQQQRLEAMAWATGLAARKIDARRFEDAKDVPQAADIVEDARNFLAFLREEDS
jgi:hypothetical protein